jgi:pyrroline-5-carboxylate reductase
VTEHSAEIGLLGVGAIAEAIVIGLSADNDDPVPVLLSPRSQTRSRALAERFASVTVAGDNQDLVDRSGTVIVCLRPQDIGAVLGALAFRPGQRVISVVAAHSLEQVQAWASPAQVVARAIPLPAVAQRNGMTAIYPPDSSTRDLFDQLGTTLCVDDESQLDSLSVATATIAAHIAYLAEISGWLASRGIDEATAAQYVAATFAPLGDQLRQDPVDLAQLARDHATPGGLNEQFLKALRDADFFELVRRSLDEVEDRVRDR